MTFRSGVVGCSLAASVALVGCVVASGTRSAGPEGNGGGGSTTTAAAGSAAEGTDTTTGSGGGTSTSTTTSTPPSPENWAVDGEPAGTPITVAGLGAQAWDLGDGRVRLHWDFSTDEQASDWPASWDSVVSRDASGALRVARNPAATDPNRVWYATFRRGIRVDRVTYRMTLVEGSHLNVFVSADLTEGPLWNPTRGTDLIINLDHCMSSGNNVTTVLSDTSVVLAHSYAGDVRLADFTIDWTLDNEVMHLGGPVTRDLTRQVAFGGYASTVLVDDITLVGTLGN